MISDSFLFTIYSLIDLSRVVRLFNFEACIVVLGIQDMPFYYTTNFTSGDMEYCRGGGG